MDEQRIYSLNVQIAQLLDPEFDYEVESIANTERYQRLVRDYEHDMNAVIDALGYDDLVIQFQPDQPLTFTIHVTSYGDEPRNPSFSASDCDDEWGNAEDGWKHPTLQQLAARALRAYLVWKAQVRS